MIQKLIYFAIPLFPLLANAQAPSGVVAKAVSPTQVDVIWVDNLPNEKGFVIERRRSGKQDFVPAGQTGPNVSRFTDKEAKPDNKYYYRVAAKLPAGNSPFSEPVTAVTPMELPGAPIDLITQVVSGKHINVMWTDRAKNESGFILERKTGPTGVFTKILTGEFDQTDFQDMSITAPGTYIYRVKAFNNGGESAYSNEASAVIKPGEKPRISPWIITRGFTKHMNLQITGESGKWLLTDTSDFKLQDGYEWWYQLGGKIVKTKTPLKNEPWNGNHPGRLVKMGAKLGLDTLSKWVSDPKEANYYFDINAGMGLDGKSGAVAVFLFK